MIFYRVCIQEYFRLVLWEVCPLSECPLSEVSLYMFILYMQGIGDSGQGAVNGVIFVLFTRQVRNKLFQTCTCHRHEHNSGACCGYFEQCICLSHRSSRDEDDSVTVAKSGSFTSIDSSLNMEKKAEEIARKTKLLKGSDSSSCEKKCVYTPLSSYET